MHHTGHGLEVVIKNAARVKGVWFSFWTWWMSQVYHGHSRSTPPEVSARPNELLGASGGMFLMIMMSPDTSTKFRMDHLPPPLAPENLQEQMVILALASSTQHDVTQT